MKANDTQLEKLMVRNSLKQKCFCHLDPSSSFHQGLQMWPKVDAEYSLHAIQRSWPRALCSLMCCMLVVFLLWPKSLCWSWCQYTSDADAEEDLMLLWCWCWGSGWSCHLLTSAWPLSKARNVAALDSNVTDFHTWVRLPDDPDDLMVADHLVMLIAWWGWSPGWWCWLLGDYVRLMMRLRNVWRCQNR